MPPLRDIKWRRWPPNITEPEKKFTPKPENEPVGSTLPEQETFMELWSTMFGPIADKLVEWMNEKGRTENGAAWQTIGNVDMLKFFAILLRMSIARRNDVKSYFHPTDGDPKIVELGFRERL